LNKGKVVLVEQAVDEVTKMTKLEKFDAKIKRKLEND